MPTTTWATARQEIVRPFGLVTGTVSAALEADTTLVDEDLADAYSSNDFFNNNWHVLVTSGNNVNEARRVTDYTGSSGAFTVSKALSLKAPKPNLIYCFSIFLPIIGAPDSSSCKSTNKK